MAQRTIVELVDDLDGSTSDDIETVLFGLDGATYEIDLSANNASNLRETLANFVGSARRAGGRVKRGLAPATVGGSTGTGRSKEQTQAIREWARTNGHAVSDRGRIPAAVIDAFEASHAIAGKIKKAK
ncbi:MAG TPA: Lsr2 family protein [Pseudonocardiaceae bacterium]|jgi:hypothetical protein|nr:Lsr2 family protein [Pseudonocardiaceae bacterium]